MDPETASFAGMPHKHYQAPVSLAPPRKQPSFEVPGFQRPAGRETREPGYYGSSPGYAGVLPRDPAKPPSWREKREVFYVADGHNGNKGETFHLDTEVRRCFAPPLLGLSCPKPSSKGPPAAT